MSNAMDEKKLTQLALQILEDHKGQDIVALPVSHLTDIADTMIVCHGTSNRHVKSLADKLREALKPHIKPTLHIEGLEEGEWVLIDCDRTMVHVLHPKARDYYRLEERWNMPPKDES